MDDEDNNLIIDTSSLTLPIIEDNEKLLSSLSSNTPIAPIETTEKVIINEEPKDNDQSQVSNLEPEQPIESPLEEQSHSPQTIVSNVIDTIINEIELNNPPFNCLPIIDDDQMEGEEDDEEDEENDEEDDEIEEPEYSEKPSSNKTNKIEKEPSVNKSPTAKGDLKPTTRTLRSHARKKSNLSTYNTTSLSSNSNNNIRRVSNRRRALDNKLLLAANEKDRKRRTISERSKKDKDSANDEMQNSSNSDDQTTEPTNGNNINNKKDCQFLFLLFSRKTLQSK